MPETKVSPVSLTWRRSPRDSRQNNGYGCCKLERYAGGFQRACVFASTYMLCKSTASTPEDLITRLILRHVFAHRFNTPRDINPESRLFWS